MWELLDNGLKDEGVNDKGDEGVTEMMEGGAEWGKDWTFCLCTPDILAGGDTVGGWLFIVLGTGLTSMAESRLRESTRVDDKGPLDDVSVGNWEFMVRAEATNAWTVEGSMGVLSPPSSLSLLSSPSFPSLPSAAGGSALVGWKAYLPWAVLSPMIIDTLLRYLKPFFLKGHMLFQC